LAFVEIPDDDSIYFNIVNYRVFNAAKTSSTKLFFKVKCISYLRSIENSTNMSANINNNTICPIVVCQNCHIGLLPDSRFCNQCGAQIVIPKPEAIRNAIQVKIPKGISLALPGNATFKLETTCDVTTELSPGTSVTFWDAATPFLLTSEPIPIIPAINTNVLIPPGIHVIKSTSRMGKKLEIPTEVSLPETAVLVESHSACYAQIGDILFCLYPKTPIYANIFAVNVIPKPINPIPVEKLGVVSVIVPKETLVETIPRPGSGVNGVVYALTKDVEIKITIGSRIRIVGLDALISCFPLLEKDPLVPTNIHMSFELAKGTIVELNSGESKKLSSQTRVRFNGLPMVRLASEVLIQHPDSLIGMLTIKDTIAELL
jgi:hypothetical protein